MDNAECVSLPTNLRVFPGCLQIQAGAGPGGVHVLPDGRGGAGEQGG